MERHIQTIGISIITAALIALATFTYNAVEKLARLDERFQGVSYDLQQATDAIERLATTAESKTDHDRDMARTNARLDDHENRLRTLESSRARR